MPPPTVAGDDDGDDAAAPRKRRTHFEMYGDAEPARKSGRGGCTTPTLARRQSFVGKGSLGASHGVGKALSEEDRIRFTTSTAAAAAFGPPRQPHPVLHPPPPPPSKELPARLAPS
jgi:hypothetical protein